MAATTIHLVRHGETDWNRDRRVQGHADVPLNETGRLQAQALAIELADVPLDAAYSSDLSRARETATIVVAQRALPITTSTALREKHFGTWEGLTDTEVRERFRTARGHRWGDGWGDGLGDGETTEAMAKRVVTAIFGIGAAHPASSVLVVTHGGPMRATLRHCDAEDGPIGNCQVVRLTAEDGVLRRVD